MNTPERLPADIEALLAVERSAPEVAADVKLRLLERLGKTIGAPVPAPDFSAANGADAAAQSASGAAQQSGLWATLAAKPALLAATMFALGTASGFGAYSLIGNKQAAPAPAPAPVIVATASPTDAGAKAAPAIDANAPTALNIDAGVPATKVKTIPRSPRSADEQLADERAILEVGRTALARGNADAAISEFARHARTFRRGRLSEEREALWIRALATKGDVGAARQRAAAFRKRYPRSLFSELVTQAVGADSP